LYGNAVYAIWSKGETQTEGVLEQGAEEHICTKRDEVVGEWRKLHNEEIPDLYSSPNNKVGENEEMGGACSPNGGKEKCVYVIVGKPEGK
jgi:hypothetical protein